MNIQFKRGNSTNFDSVTLLAGEPAFVLDLGELWIGDGDNKVCINSIKPSDLADFITDDDLTTALAPMATKNYVDSAVANLATTDYVDSAIENINVDGGTF